MLVRIKLDLARNISAVDSSTFYVTLLSSEQYIERFQLANKVCFRQYNVDKVVVVWGHQTNIEILWFGVISKIAFEEQQQNNII